jgi:hypothetical protein
MLFESLLLVEATKLNDVAPSVVAPLFDSTDELRQRIAQRTKIANLMGVTAEARSDTQTASKASYLPHKGTTDESTFAEESSFDTIPIDEVSFPKTTSESQKRYPVFLLLHHFMLLNARLLEQLPGKTITDEWMEIAGSLVQLAALETIDGLNDSATNTSNDVELVRPTIADCFAYHHVPVLKQLKGPDGMDISEDFGLDASFMVEEQAISDMFRSCEVTWEAVRRRYLEELFTDRVANLPHRLEEYHALIDKVMKSVYNCLAVIFRINNLPEISGRPALVQIEEGGLDGLSQEKFEVFAERVGLTKVYEQ